MVPFLYLSQLSESPWPFHFMVFSFPPKSVSTSVTNYINWIFSFRKNSHFPFWKLWIKFQRGNWWNVLKMPKSWPKTQKMFVWSIFVKWPKLVALLCTPKRRRRRHEITVGGRKTIKICTNSAPPFAFQISSVSKYTSWSPVPTLFSQNESK